MADDRLNLGSSSGDFEETLRRAQEVSSSMDELRRKEEQRAGAEEQTQSVEVRSAGTRTNLAGATQELSRALQQNIGALADETAAVSANTAALTRNLELRRQIAQTPLGSGSVASAAAPREQRIARAPVTVSEPLDPLAGERLDQAYKALAAAERERDSARRGVSQALRPTSGATSGDVAGLVETREVATQNVQAARDELKAAQRNVELQNQRAAQQQEAVRTEARLNAALQEEAVRAASAAATAAARVNALGPGQAEVQGLLERSGSLAYAAPPGTIIPGVSRGSGPDVVRWLDSAFPSAAPGGGGGGGRPPVPPSAAAAGAGDAADGNAKKLAAHQALVESNARALSELGAKQRQTTLDFNAAGAAYSDASTRLTRHGAMTTEFIQSFARGEVTLREFGEQVTSTVGKFGGWAIAGALVYGVFDALKKVKDGATETQAAVLNLGRFLPGLGGPYGGGTGQVDAVQHSLRNVSAEFNLPISDVSDAMQLMARTFHTVSGAAEGARAVLAAFRLDQVPVAQGAQYLTGIHNAAGGMAGSDPISVVNSLNELQTHYSARVSQTLPAVSRAAPAFLAAGGDIPTLETLAGMGARAGLPGGVIGTALARMPQFAFRTTSEETYAHYGINAQRGDINDLITQIMGTIRRRAASGNPLEGGDFAALARALSSNQIGARAIAPILAEQQLDTSTYTGMKRSTTHPASFEQDLARVTGTLSERFASLGHALERFGSQIEQSGVLNPVLEFMNLLGSAAHLMEQLVSPLSRAVGLFSQLPSAVQLALGAFAGVAVARRLSNMRSGQTALDFLGRLPGMEELRNRTSASVVGTRARISRELVPLASDEVSAAERQRQQATGALRAAQSRVSEYQSAHAGSLDQPGRAKELGSLVAAQEAAEKRLVAAEERALAAQQQLAQYKADMVMLGDRSLTFAERAVYLEQQGYVAQKEYVDLLEQRVAGARAGLKGAIGAGAVPGQPLTEAQLAAGDAARAAAAPGVQLIARGPVTVSEQPPDPLAGERAAERVQQSYGALAAAEQEAENSRRAVKRAVRPTSGATQADVAGLVEAREVAAQNLRAAREELKAALRNAELQAERAALQEQAVAEAARLNVAEAGAKGATQVGPMAAPVGQPPIERIPTPVAAEPRVAEAAGPPRVEFVPPPPVQFTRPTLGMRYDTMATAAGAAASGAATSAVERGQALLKGIRSVDYAAAAPTALLIGSQLVSDAMPSGGLANYVAQTGGTLGMAAMVGQQIPKLGVKGGLYIGAALNTVEAATQGKWGTAAGSAVGGVAGGVLGSFLGPEGTVLGGAIGSALGSTVGGAIGGLFDSKPPSPADVTNKAAKVAGGVIRGATASDASLQEYGANFQQRLETAYMGSGSASSQAQANITAQMARLQANVSLFGGGSPQGKASQAVLSEIIKASINEAATGDPVAGKQALDNALQTKLSARDALTKFSMAENYGPTGGLSASRDANRAYESYYQTSVGSAVQDSASNLQGAELSLAAAQESHNAKRIQIAKTYLAQSQRNYQATRHIAQLTHAGITLSEQEQAAQGLQSDLTFIQAQGTLAVARAGGNKPVAIQRGIDNLQSQIRRVNLSRDQLAPQAYTEQMDKLQGDLVTQQNARVQEQLTQMQGQGALRAARVPTGDPVAAAKVGLDNATRYYHFMKDHLNTFGPDAVTAALAGMIDAAKQFAQTTVDTADQLAQGAEQLAELQNYGNAAAIAQVKLRAAYQAMARARTPQQKQAAQIGIQQGVIAGWESQQQGIDSQTAITVAQHTGDSVASADAQLRGDRQKLATVHGVDNQRALAATVLKDEASAQQARFDRIKQQGQLQEVFNQGDPVAVARVALQTAQGERRAARTYEQQVQAAQDMVNAEYQLQAAQFALIDARARVREAQAQGDPVAVARITRQNAENERQAARTVQQQQQATIDLANANQQFSQALQQHDIALGSLAASETREPLQQLTRQIAAAQKSLADARGPANRQAAQEQLNQLRNQYEGTYISQTDSTIQFQLSMQQITAQQALAQIQALEHAKGITTDELQKLEQEARNIQLGSGTNFNFAPGSGDLGLPTLYDIRHRAEQGRLFGVNGGRPGLPPAWVTGGVQQGTLPLDSTNPAQMLMTGATTLQTGATTLTQAASALLAATQAAARSAAHGGVTNNVVVHAAGDSGSVIDTIDRATHSSLSAKMRTAGLV